ncbi:FUSC family protein [Micromonospora saelicesensis]|uniref:FUSC family protein n=1 Tax=Micromonospora saelicesensis TaxID=285676 RepID=UPI003CF855A7
MQQRFATGAWLLLQQALAATVAWVIAEHVIDHHEPFFAPIAAVIALNTFFGQRGSNALRLLQGVVVGIGIGELTLAVLGKGYGQLAIALFVAMAIAQATGGTRITVAQAAIGAILTVAVGNAETGIQRLADAMIGAGVALVFTQVLFSPEPLGRLRRVQRAALTEMANALRLAGRALADADEHEAPQALDPRALRDQITELARVRQTSVRVARHSVVWRRRTPLVLREYEKTSHLDRLGDSCLLLTRVALQLPTGDHRWLATHLDDLASTLGDLSYAIDDLEARRAAAFRVRRTTRHLVHDLNVHTSPIPESQEAITVTLIKIVVADIVVFADADRVGT